MSTPIPYRLKRRIEQIATLPARNDEHAAVLFALASDGTLWVLHDYEGTNWCPVAELPDIEEKSA